MKLLKLLVVVGLLNGLVACSESETADIYLEKAKSYIKENKVDESIIELKNAIKKAPKNNEARFLLGKLYLQQGSGFDAVKELEKAHDLNYLSNKVIPLLARAYLMVNSDEDVISLSEQAIALPDEVKSQYLAYNTLANIRLQDNESAKKSVELANQLTTPTSYSYLASAYLLLSENQVDSAKIKVTRSLELAPADPEAIMLLGQINTTLGLFSDATENYLSYAKLQPRSSMVILLLADSSLKDKDYKNAEKYADLILSKIPNQPIAHYVKSVAKFEVKDYKNASMHAEQAELFGLNSPQLKLVAGASAYYLSNFEQSYRYLNSIADSLPADHPAMKMFAISQLQLGLISDITDTLSDFTVTNKADAKFLSTLSIQLAEIGAVDDAKQIAAKVTSKAPENAEESVRTGILKLMLNDPSGMTNLQDAVTLKPDMISAELALVSAAIQVNDFDKALEISKDWQERYPNKPAAFNVLATVYLKQGKLDSAVKALNSSLKLLPQNQFALTNLINIAMKRDDTDEAARLSELGLGYFPDNEKMLKQYYAVYRGDDQKRALASEKVKVAHEAKQDDMALGLLYAEVLLDQKEFKQALAVLESFEPTIHSPNKFWKLKIFALRNVDKAAGMVTALESWMKTNPYAIEPALLLVDSQLRAKDVTSALRTVDRALASGNKNNEMLKIAKMQILLDSRELNKAKYYLPEFSSNEMNVKVVRGAEGRIHLLEKNYVQAIPLLSEFYSDFPTSKNALLLAVSQNRAKKSDAAINTLKDHLEKNDSDTQVRSLLANLYLENYPERSIPLYEKMLIEKPENIVFLNNLAWLNLENNNLELAMKYSAEAVKLASKNPNVLDTRGMVLLKAGETAVALKALENAYELSNGNDVSIALNYAEALIANKKNKEALSLLKALNGRNSKQTQRINSLIALAS